MDRLTERLGAGIVLFDGSMGALLGQMGYADACPERYCVEAPDVIRQIHRRYIEAGARVLISNSLGATPIGLRKHGFADRAAEFAAAAVRLARAEAGDDALVALDIGTVGAFLRPLGELTLDQLVAAYLVPLRAGMDAGADFVLAETMIDIADARAVCLAARELGAACVVSMTYGPQGRTMTGGAPGCAALCAQALCAVAAGINCSMGPEQMRAPLCEIRSACALPVIVQPNAGVPSVIDGKTVFPLSASDMLPHMKALIDAGAAAIGGCCGTTPEHIRAFAPLCHVQPPQPVFDGTLRICSTRTALPLADALANIVTIEDMDELYDLEAGQCAQLDIRGLAPMAAAELVIEAQSICHPPLILRGEGEALIEALRHYAGVAAVQAPAADGQTIALYGAHRI